MLCPMDTLTLVRYSDISAIVAVFFVSLDAAPTTTPLLPATRSGSAVHPDPRCCDSLKKKKRYFTGVGVV